MQSIVTPLMTKLATLVVWLVTAIATMVLPMVFLKKPTDKKHSGGATRSA